MMKAESYKRYLFFHPGGTSWSGEPSWLGTQLVYMILGTRASKQITNRCVCCCFINNVVPALYTELSRLYGKNNSPPSQDPSLGGRSFPARFQHICMSTLRRFCIENLPKWRGGGPCKHPLIDDRNFVTLFPRKICHHNS